MCTAGSGGSSLGAVISMGSSFWSLMPVVVCSANQVSLITVAVDVLLTAGSNTYS